MAHLILIRHAQTLQEPAISSHKWTLTDSGKAMCNALADKLHPYDIDKMITSEEEKARLTGQLTAAVLGIPCESAPDLHETKRETAPYSGNLTDFQAAVQVAMRQPDKLLFGEETFAAAHQRFATQVDTLLEQYSGQTLAIVTHGTVMSLYLAHVTGRDVVDLWLSLDMPAYAVLALPEKSLATLMPSIV